MMRVRDSVGDEVILGQKLTNAYSVASMTAALNYYNARFVDTAYIGKRITTTHLYIEILPETEFDLIELEDLDQNSEDIVLSEYPLDYEIIQEGSHYRNPAHPDDDGFQPLYSVIPVGHVLNVPYRVLENLYQPKESENDLETIALAMCGWKEDLMADFDREIDMTNVNQFLDGPHTGNGLFSRRFNPNGFVRVHTYDLGGSEGLKYARLKVGRGVWWHTVYTNEEGLFWSSERYRGKVRVRSTWRNLTATLRMTWYETMGVDVSDHIASVSSSQPFVWYEIQNEGNDERLWCKGVVHNATVKYYGYAYTNGITPVTGANIWVWEGRNTMGDASTPMLKRYPVMAAMASINGWSQPGFWSNLMLHLGSEMYMTSMLTMPHLMPDQIYTRVNQRGTSATAQSNRVVEQLVFHESAHFSHALKCGSWNYSNLFAAELKNSIDNGDPYYTGQTPTAACGQQIALFEGWATFIENKCMQHFYSVSYDYQGVPQNLPDYMEQYNMFQTPFTIGNRTDARSWFLSGLLWDLDDDHAYEINSYLNTGGGTQLHIIADRMYLVNAPGNIYQLLTSGVYNGEDLKYSLLSSFPNNSLEINSLFSSYDY